SGRTAATLDQVASTIRAAGGRCDVAPLDVGDKAAVRATADRLLAAHNRIDVLVNSAGINLRERAWANVSTDGWDDVVRINLDGTFYCCHAVLPAMRAQGDGLIVNVSSWLGKHVSPLAGPSYTATKFGAAALTESINAEYGRHGVRATALKPGEAATPLMERRPVKPHQAELDRMLQEEDLGRTILFLATLPARVCVNDMIVTPTWNRFYIGGLETTQPTKD
ncbi:MAG: SDR family oxidoreductase, partial [Rhodospirillales bacterium]|nr:SDR family oxidoreductase [Rhodospirillales bacterium]